jgi:stage III sporulation protein SpoIIIAA
MNPSNDDPNFYRLMDALTGPLQSYVEEHFSTLEELYLPLDRPITVKRQTPHGPEYETLDLCADEALFGFVRNRATEFRENGRAGLDFTLHRVSRTLGFERVITGLTLRLARFIPGIVEPFAFALEDLLKTQKGLVIIGPPGVGKTSIQRGNILHLQSRLKIGLVVVDSSGELTGDGNHMHPAFGDFKRVPVIDSSQLHRHINEAVINLTPEVLLVDELSHHSEADAVQYAARRGTRLLCTLHGYSLRGALEIPVNQLLLGNADLLARKRSTEVIFQSALVITERGRYEFHPNLASSIDALLQDREPATQRLQT